MRKITDFQVYDLGIENSQYFQGFGTSGTGYDECAYGIGDNPSEALDDCLEQIAQMGFDADDLAKRILQVEGPAPVTPSVADSRDDSEDDGDESGYDDCYYHIGIRWNAEGSE